MASTDSLPIARKNVAYRVVFPILDADGDLVTGATGLDSEVSKDQGTFTDCTNEATEIATSSGMYYLDLTSTEMNADCVAVIVKTSSSGAKTTPIVIYPLEDGDWRVNVVQLLGTAWLTPGTAGTPDVNAKLIGATPQTGRDIGASVLLSSGTGAGQVSLSSGTVTLTDASLTAAKIASDAITAAKIADGAIDAATFAAGAINAAAIAADAITAAKIADGAIDAATFAAGAINAAAIAADAITDAKVAADVTIASVTGSVGSVTGAVGSVTGAVGSVTGAVGSVTGAVGSVTGNVGGNVVGSVASVTAAVAITSNIKKNQALAKFQFLMTDSTTHAPKTGVTVTCTRSIDGGAFAAGTLANVAELSNGTYLVDFGAGDLNGNVIVLRATGTASDDAFERIVTQS